MSEANQTPEPMPTYVRVLAECLEWAEEPASATIVEVNSANILELTKMLVYIRAAMHVREDTIEA